MIYYVIPARRNSVGVPFKNRKLLDHTLNVLPDDCNLIVSTDDEFIIDRVKEKAIVIERCPELSKGDICIKDVMVDVVEKCSLKDDDVVIMLYLVYPQRTELELDNAIEFFQVKGASSMLCKYDAKPSPYLCFYEKPGHKGEPVIKHSFHRRQDYLECFFISHYLCMFKVGELPRLKNDLYNEDTLYYKIKRPIDVDTKEDLDEFIRSRENE
jgi:CMP-N-acetylneuraminic acid synthetase